MSTRIENDNLSRGQDGFDFQDLIRCKSILGTQGTVATSRHIATETDCVARAADQSDVSQVGSSVDRPPVFSRAKGDGGDKVFYCRA